MRKSVIVSVALHTLVGAAALLWLLWYFIPAGNAFKVLVTLLVALLAAGIVWKNSQRRKGKTDSNVSVTDWPLSDTREPLVLVCGDGLNELFQGQSLRRTAQGWWLNAGEPGRLTDVVRGIVAQFPRQCGQLSVMYCCRADLYEDEAVLRSALKTLRQQIRQLHTLTGFMLPVVLSCELSGPETPWCVVRGARPVMYPANDIPLTLADWQQSDKHIGLLPLLREAFSFVRATLLDELEKPDRVTPAVRTLAVAMRLRAVTSDRASVWAGWLHRRAALRFIPVSGHPLSPRPFPDGVLPLLAPFASPAQGGQRSCRLVLLVWGCVLAALGFSALNNRDLIRQVSNDLARWYAIPGDHYAPKAESLTALKQDALLLERWQRQGEPLRYGLGYYPGHRLWLVLQQAIDTYVPPPPPKPAPKIVRLDSMSLFDPGRAALKDGSTRVLVNALVGIKARPGWLIVVSGHTDNTGNKSLNQSLSLQRAEAVRNWMRDTGDVPESCFAVQGYGDSRPVASNDTPDGRAHNRRVEISLVPQADACRLPGATTASPDVRDVSTQ